MSLWSKCHPKRLSEPLRQEVCIFSQCPFYVPSLHSVCVLGKHSWFLTSFNYFSQFPPNLPEGRIRSLFFFIPFFPFLTEWMNGVKLIVLEEWWENPGLGTTRPDVWTGEIVQPPWLHAFHGRDLGSLSDGAPGSCLIPHSTVSWRRPAAPYQEGSTNAAWFLLIHDVSPGTENNSVLASLYRGLAITVWHMWNARNSTSRPEFFWKLKIITQFKKAYLV